MEFNNVDHAPFAQKIKVIKTIFANMTKKSRDAHGGGILLDGDPGVGKTSFIRDFATLMGLNLITIEVPHIVEEHIINIPFIVFNSGTGHQENLNVKINPEDGDTASDYDVKLARSNLFSRIQSTHKVPDAEYLKRVYSAPGHISEMFEALGGSETEIPAKIQELRNSYRCVLFLDEFYRSTSSSIRNILRGILNRKLGIHSLPKDLYVIYASNMNDEGVEDVMSNEDFRMINFDNPSKDEWFKYLVAKFKHDHHVKLNETVLEKFHKAIEGEHMVASEIDKMGKMIRTSPRRWEQLILYVNQALPVKDHEEAKSLLTHVRQNFRHYESGEEAAIADKITDAVSKLIKETSEIEINSREQHASSDWIKSLEHNIKQKMKSGGNLKYIPVISGLPGIGKTSKINQLSLDLNMVPVYVAVQNLKPEDVIGVPLSKKNKKKENDEDGEIEVQFSHPALYDTIKRLIREGERDMAATYKAHFSADEAKKRLDQYRHQKFKYIIFFDELNRADSRVFNAIRRVMLEKSFGDGRDLPEGSVLVGAINPDPNSGGTTELTDHLRDVVDFIPAGVTWLDWKRSVVEKLDLKKHEKEEGSSDIVLEAFEKIVDKFRPKKNVHKEADPHFFLNIGASEVYFSPREYTDMVTDAAAMFDDELHEKMDEIDVNSTDADKKLETMERELRHVLYDAFEPTFRGVMKKHKVESPEFLRVFKEWIITTNEIAIGDIFRKKAEVMNLKDIIDTAYDDPHSNLYDDVEFVNYLEAVEPQRFREDLQEFLEFKVKEDEKTNYSLFRKNDHPKKEYSHEKGKAEPTKEMVTKIEHFLRELIHAIQIHKLGSQKMKAVQLAIRTVMGGIENNDLSKDIVDIHSRIFRLIRQMPTA